MYKIYKTQITGFDLEGYEETIIGVNSNYRVTMGYNDTEKKISVKVDKLVKPDLTRDEDAEISYVTVDSKNFVPADFIQYSDNMAWVVEFDADQEKILAPFNVLAYTKTLIDSSSTHQDIWKMIKERHSGRQFPCFHLESFYKKVTDFSASVLTFHTTGADGSPDTTIIEAGTTPAPVEMATQDRIKDIQSNYVTNIIFQILDSDGNVVTNKQPTSIFGNAFDADAKYAKTRGNQFHIDLAAASEYKIRVNYITGYTDKTISAQFDVNCINGVPSKTRLISGKRTGQTTDLSYLGATNATAKFAGYEDVIIDNKLSAGDFIKFKLDCGDQITYAELMINLV